MDNRLFLRVFCDRTIMSVMSTHLSTKMVFSLLGTSSQLRRKWYFDRYLRKSHSFEKKCAVLEKARDWRRILGWVRRCKVDFNLEYDPHKMDACTFFHNKIGRMQLRGLKRRIFIK